MEYPVDVLKNRIIFHMGEIAHLRLISVDQKSRALLSAIDRINIQISELESGISCFDSESQETFQLPSSKSALLHAVRKWNADHPSDAIVSEDVAEALGKRIDDGNYCHCEHPAYNLKFGMLECCECEKSIK